MKHLDETFWWEIWMRNLDETFGWDILMKHFDETFLWDILMRFLMGYLDETFRWDILMRHFNETFWWYSLKRHFNLGILIIHFDETLWWLEMVWNLSLIWLYQDSLCHCKVRTKWNFKVQFRFVRISRNMCIWHQKLCNAKTGVGPTFTWSNEAWSIFSPKIIKLYN